MSAAIGRLAPTQETASENRRRRPRVATQAVAQLSSLHGENVRVAVGDVSTHGCSVRCTSGWLRGGSFVSIGIDDETPLRAVVRWVRNDLAGLEFLRPVPADRREWHSLMGWNA